MTHEEQQQQTALFNWAAIMEHQIPELALMYHIPNEGQRSKVSGAILKSMGLKRGIPDVCLPVPRGGHGALYIEMKAEHGAVTREQKAMMAALEEGGNKCVVCRSWTDAKEEIEEYLKLGRPVNARDLYADILDEYYIVTCGISELIPRGKFNDETTIEQIKQYLLKHAKQLAQRYVEKNIKYDVESFLLPGEKEVPEYACDGRISYSLPFFLRNEVKP